MTKTPERRPGSRGPLPTGKGVMIGVRVQPDMLAALDALIAARPEPKPTRPEAIRTLIERGLETQSKKAGKAS